MKYDVSTFGFKAAVLIVTAKYGVHIPTEVSNIILFYPSFKKAMVDSQCETMWTNNSAAGLELNHTEDYVSGIDDP